MENSRKPRHADLDAHFSAFLQQHFFPGQHVVLGLSGGLDSRVLLHLLANARQQMDFKLSAIHINHRISPNADGWANFCAELCANDGIPFQAVAVDVPRDSGLGLEAAAREARYRVLLAQDADAIVLAHHQDDQAETLLLQLLRGAGVKGLAAMPGVRYQGSGIKGPKANIDPSLRTGKSRGEEEKPILRPLLDVSRSVLFEYAKAHGLEWIEDESNLDLAYDRNYLRSRILPELEQRFPAARKTLARSASHLAEAAALLEEVAREDAVCAVSDGRLDLAMLKAMSAARATNLLRWWVAQQSGVPISTARLADIRSQLLNAKPDARIHISLGMAVLCRRRGFALIERAGDVAPARRSPEGAAGLEQGDATHLPE
ncbi:MAG: tRNA lysidine(34) synthetase TilS [Methylophilales bacterium RIFCSPHIGHO2_02_FULL_57_10]|nr:MAG: tRNA lysidine(34) synthetase TilS [Methylophilales bacterium RIFCSPHIGHO2_02_FULL_57_10]